MVERLARLFDMVKLLTLVVLVGLVSVSAQASELLGDLAVSGIFLEPSFTYSDNHQGSFQPGNSFIAATWTRDSEISAVLKVGSRSLINQPARYGSTDGSQIAMIEAYGQMATSYGRVRAGMIPIPFGVEGGDAEERLRFPRSQVFSRGLIGLRDQGLSYHISNAGYFSDWAIHNGEGGPDLDNELWFTMRMGWQGGRFFRLGISGQTGRTNPSSTDPGALVPPPYTINQAGMDQTKASKVRLANLFLDWEDDPTRLEFEMTTGDTIQDDDGGGTLTYGVRAAHLDYEYLRRDQWSALARIDTYDPNISAAQRTDQYTVGLSLKSKYETSALYFFVTDTLQENVPGNVYSFQLIWRMTPAANSYFAPL
jgi:hypothetical protein